ncbi:redoxin family protein [Mesorhizobium sp. M0814]|uniref:redoxin family protein n=1 Tax=Mesorhizobium sp. M0814 TaxID=2957004 RepID=UPI0033362CE0
MTRFVLTRLPGVCTAIKWSGWLGNGGRPILGVVVVAGAAIIWLGLDTGLLTRWSIAGTAGLEQDLIGTSRHEPVWALSTVAHAAPTLSGPLVSLLGARQWLNSQPLRPEDLRGRVVLVNFWTYTCINSLRALPYLRAWAEKYKDRGLVVIGVHTPEFAFEKHFVNVGKQLGLLGVDYPVVIDNDYGIWRAFGNRAWPAFHFVGADGRVRHHVFGERDYDQSERLIQKLLSEATGEEIAGDLVAVAGEGPQAAADKQNLRSPESYVGYALGRTFVSPGGVNEDAPTLYQAVQALSLNRWSLAGIWTIGSEFATLNDPSGSISYRFHSRDLHLVLAPAVQGQGIRFRVKIDGAPPGVDHGFDTDPEGWGNVQDGRMYQLVRQRGSVEDRTFQIEFFDAGVRAYAFTFG